MENGSVHSAIGEDKVSPGQKRSARGDRLGRWGAGLLLGYLTLASMFMYSGVIAHSHTPPVHPLAGHVGWILGGLSPLGAYLGFRLSRGKSRSVARLCVALGIAACVFVGLQVLGLALLQYALPGQPVHMG